ncbi:MAG TPA: response regulator, partial [Candidatus Ozemobacteraceae bacterium]|nr:response regulator [Candidatus Ozemobacteraceae bacterium]
MIGTTPLNSCPLPGRARILITDDLEPNRLLLAELCQSLGHLTSEAEDGFVCLEQARANHPDLILLDLLMPRLNGFETLAQLKADPDLLRIPVIII